MFLFAFVNASIATSCAAFWNVAPLAFSSTRPPEVMGAAPVPAVADPAPSSCFAFLHPTPKPATATAASSQVLFFMDTGTVASLRDALANPMWRDGDGPRIDRDRPRLPSFASAAGGGARPWP